MKDTEFYAQALEKENHFLREEIEKSKYSKDKNEYSKFLSGLTQIRNKKPQTTTTLQSQSTKDYTGVSPISTQSK